MRRATLGVLAALLLTDSSDAQENSVRAHPYVGYHFSETRKTDSDHRKISIEIFLTGDDYVGFRYREDVFGSISPVVKAVRFENEYRRKATTEEQSHLTRELLRAGVFDLKAEPWNEKSRYSSRLDVRINKRMARYSFNTPASPGKRRAVHDVMLRFAERIRINHPLSEKQATTVSEGDFQPPRDVMLAELVADPAKFHGKRVSTIGYYHWEFEGSSLSVSPQASRNSDYRNSIWKGEISTFANNSAINDTNDAWMRVDGVFLRGPGGHLGLWPGEIVRLTRIEPLRSPPR